MTSRAFQDIDTGELHEFQCDHVHISYNGINATITLLNQRELLNPQLVNILRSMNNVRFILDENRSLDFTNLQETVYSFIDGETEEHASQIRIVCDLLF